MIYTEIDHWIV